MFLLIPIGLFANSIMSNESDYLDICKRAAANPAVFSSFRRHKAIIRGIEGLSPARGLACIKKIPQDYLSRLKELDVYDALGNSKRHFYQGIGNYSPCTLRYVMVLANLKKRFGPLDNLRVVEIGGGFGGLCAVMSTLESKAHYTLIDLPCVLDLAKVFLDKLNIQNVSYIRHDQLQQVGQYDLLISNYAFSEIEAKYQLEYLEKVIKHVPRGFMTINFTGKLFGIKSLTRHEIKNFLEKAGHKVVIENELTQTTPRNTNILMTWGNDLQK